MKPDLDKLSPLLEKHNGNFSAAMRELIDFGWFAIEKCGNIERAKERIMVPQPACNDLREDDQLVLQVVKVIRKK